MIRFNMSQRIKLLKQASMALLAWKRERGFVGCF
jgi:hypothetical protein